MFCPWLYRTPRQKYYRVITGTRESPQSSLPPYADMIKGKQPHILKRYWIINWRYVYLRNYLWSGIYILYSQRGVRTNVSRKTMIRRFFLSTIIFTYFKGITMKNLMRLCMSFLVCSALLLAIAPASEANGSCGSLSIENATTKPITISLFLIGTCANANTWTSWHTLAPGASWSGTSLPGPNSGCCFERILIQQSGQGMELTTVHKMLTLTGPLAGCTLNADQCTITFFWIQIFV